MSHKLPVDLQRKLKTKFPDVDNLDEIVNYVFELILDKTLDDGACPIQSFGTFYSYKAFSNKKGTYVPRFKFRISRALMNSMCNDEYTLQRIERVVSRLVDTGGKFKNAEVQACRDLNYQRQNDVLYNQKEIRKKTIDNVVQDEINKILNEEFENK